MHSSAIGRAPFVVHPAIVSGTPSVIPAKAGTHIRRPFRRIPCLWVPAFAGMTDVMDATSCVGRGEAH